MPKKKTPADPKKLTDRQYRAWELRERGLSWGQIAKELGCGKGQARTAALRGQEKLDRAEDLQMSREDLLPTLRVESAMVEPSKAEIEKVRDLFRDLNMPTNMASAVVNRLKAVNGLAVDVASMPTNDAKIAKLENLFAMAAEFVDPYILAQASAKDLVNILGTLVDKIQLLKGEPTQIMGFKEREDMDSLAAAIQAELDRRMKVIPHEPSAPAP